ncbi:isoprenylcysteine carboxylmethyltransferase family protein [Dechloromonas sp. HYN0024]|uniref:methyltransferase family protein n=1 Tax=Dechloromonas sp. HYN0024 TaxID=2231055 RepID=UPI000E42DD24|nr:isoprenylcysteine carboxylmethyltransferase family protein [Dechloromonas sp. HYN0024]AXS79618.1 isoprenylcysteine carboxylmethyltransferase family protein [Dechloromonas sp. HYN0024]
MVEFLTDAQALAAGTATLAWLSRKPLSRLGSHGFYRFFAWEAILGLLVLNRQFLDRELTTLNLQVASLLLLISIGLALTGLLTLYRQGHPDRQRDDPSFYAFEKTTQLVSTGIFGYIRHPMYSSLLALAWGTYLLDPGLTGSILVGAATLFLWLTARTDEKECLAYFGPVYAEYAQRTKRFIPFLF